MIESPDVLARLRDLLERGGAILGTFDRSIVSRSRALELIDILIESLPDEIDQAREIMKDAEEILEKARRQAGEIVDDAVRKAERLVDADVISVDAGKRAEELMGDADDYVARRLQDLEEELARLLSEVRAGIKAVGGPRKARGTDADDFNLDKL